MEQPTSLDYNKLREKVRGIYGAYLQNPNNHEIKEKAQSINAGYRTAHSLVSKELEYAIDTLLHIGLDLNPIPSKSEIKEIIKNLKKEEQLENKHREGQ